MKNITIVTWHSQGNFGTNLQACALYKKIESLGYNTRIVTSIPMRYNLKTTIQGILRLFGYYKWKEFRADIRKAKGKSFSEANMQVIPRIFFFWQEKKLVKDTDVFVSGSDQIWNTYFKYDPISFLSFAQNKKRIAYASSIGTRDFCPDSCDQVRQHLLKFAHIGVREESAVKAISNLTGRKDVCQVLDPTFLLQRSEWQELVKDTVVGIEIPERYILVYLLGRNGWYKEQLADVVKKTGIKNVVVIPSVEYNDFTYDGAICYPECGTDEFIKLLFSAAVVCTDSFHASALSINFSKDFVEFLRFKDTDKASQNSRIYDLLAHYGLMDRIYNLSTSSWAMGIDYSNVQDILNFDREKSICFLKNSIEN